MQNQLHEYLKRINLNEDYIQVFESAEITNVILDKETKKLLIDITIDNLFDPHIYKELTEKKNALGNTSITFKLTNKPNDALITEYYKYFIDVCYKGVITDVLKSLFVELYNDRLTISVTSSLIQETLDALKGVLEKSFSKIGLPYPIDVVYNSTEELDNMKKIIEEENKTVKENLISSQPSFASEAKYEPNRDFYKKEFVKVPLDEITNDSTRVETEGRVFSLEVKTTKNGFKIFTFYVTNDKSSLVVKARETKSISLELLNTIEEGDYLRLKGGIIYDTYLKDYVFDPYQIAKFEYKNEITDNAPEKRVELHLHTKMSAMDGVTYVQDFVKRAAEWGHKAIAITDHASTQSFPDAQEAAEGKDIKVIYGMEGYVCDNIRKPAINPKHVNLKSATYVVFDLETTGLSSHYDKITELGFVKVKDGMIIDTWQQFVNPLQRLHPIISNKTNITDDMLISQPTIDQLLPKILEFIGDSILVAHNGTFDLGFLDEAFLLNGYPKLSNPLIETIDLAHCIFPQLKRFSLGAICKNFGIKYDEDSAHRADYDARVLADLFSNMLEKLSEMGVEYHDDLNALSPENTYLKERPYHMNFLCKNETGLKNLYKMLSLASTEYIADYPIIVKGKIEQFREGLLVGAGCFNSEVFEIAQTKSFNELKEIIRFYDYIEVQPLENYSWLLKTERLLTEDRLKHIVVDIIKAAKEENKLIVATGDVHYLDPKDKIYRDIFIVTNSVGNKPHPLCDSRYPDALYSPEQHFRTTQEMLDCFSFLNNPDLEKEIVITNPNIIADQIEVIKPIKKILRTPKLKGIDTDVEIRNMCESRAHELYGEQLPDLVKERMEKELTNIIKNGYSVIYYLAYRLVNKSNTDGYLVGSRGSVGSSFVASLCKITEVNPLPPHYLCPECHHVEFFTDGSVRSGFDLPEKACPECGHIMNSNGQNIPFETFLGLNCDKVPDIDLNFSRDYQAKAHDYTKVLCGEKNVFRGGTVSKVATKTAYGYAKGYFEKHNLEYPSSAELKRLATGCEEVKRTSGQHPAGIIVIPDELSVYDFTPIQYPADDTSNAWITTHYKYDYLHEDVLKLDILGHLDPMALKMLRDLTGVDPETIPMNDPEVYALFTGLTGLNVQPYDVLNDIGTSGIPEFGTNFVKGVVQECKPNKFSDLVQISGLTHGKEVWQGNAQELIRSGKLSLMQVIGCRDDIMTDLINFGMEKIEAFKIMEFVRKGKPNKEPDKWAKIKQQMIDANIPDWYIESCHKINYMFPKAHAVAYVVMALRVAWFKVHYPIEYYAAYFSVRCDQFDVSVMIKGHEAIKDKVKELRAAISSKTNASTDGELHETMELALEMTARGYKFNNISLEHSDATRFVIDKEHNALYPPFITLKGLGEAAAQSVVEARNEKPFISKNDLSNRTRLTQTNIKNLEELGALDSLDSSDQLAFHFDFDQ